MFGVTMLVSQKWLKKFGTLLKATKKRLMKWSRSVFGDIHEEVEVGIAKPKHFRNILSSGVASSQLIQLEKEAYNRLSALCFYKKSIGSKNLV